jgi:hypothetical protein
MADEIFIESHNPTSRRWAILEGNSNSAWLYLTEAGQPKPDKDAFVYSPIPPIKDLNIEDIKNGESPILTESIASTSAVINSAQAEDFTFLWSTDGESVAVLHKSTPLAMITKDSKSGFSKSLSKESFFGNPWEQSIYNKYFE